LLCWPRVFREWFLHCNMRPRSASRKASYIYRFNCAGLGRRWQYVLFQSNSLPALKTMMSSSALFSEVVSSPNSCDTLVVRQVQSSRYKRKACRIIVPGLLGMMEKRMVFRRQIFYLEQTTQHRTESVCEIQHGEGGGWTLMQPEYFHILARATTPHSKRVGVWCISV